MIEDLGQDMRRVPQVRHMGSRRDLAMKRLLVAVALLFAQPATAATISVLLEGTADHPALILINGRFEKAPANDDEIALFSAYAADAEARKKGAILWLDSIGGTVWAAITKFDFFDFV
jgi:hypothetical protein